MDHSFWGKKYFLLLLSFCAFSAQSQDILWEKSYGGKHAEFLFDAIPTPDYGFILAGSSLSNKNGNKSDDNKGNFDYWVWKMNETGDLDWQKSFGGSGEDHLQSIQLTIDGGFILAGTSNSNKGIDKKDDSKGDADFWIIKLDAKGNEQWQRTIGGNGQEQLYSITTTRDGGYIIGGSSASDATPLDKNGKEDKFGKKEKSRGNLDFWIVKLTKDGNTEWQKTIGGQYADELKSIVQTKDGGYILGGHSNSSSAGEKEEDAFGEGDFWIVKTDSKGTIEWQKTIGGNNDDNLYVLLQTTDGGYIAAGNSNSGATDSKTVTNGKGTDFWVVKLDYEGIISWQQTYDFGKLDILTSMSENPDGSFLIGGYAQSEMNNPAKGGLKITSDKEGINDYIALKINSKGEELWSKTVGSQNDEVMRKLFETRDGGYLLAGTSYGASSRDKSSSNGSSDFWVVKLKDNAKPERERVRIEAVPNPVATFTNAIINYDYAYGTATLYNLNGRQLQQVKINGEHTVPFDLSHLPSGIYIINISTNVEQNGIKVIKN